MSKDAFAVKDPDGALVVFGVSMTPFSYMAQPARMAARLQHFVTATDDIDPLTAFYRDRLHFRVADEVRDEKSALRAVFLRTDEEHHSRAIFLADRKRLDHHCYELADWNALRDWGDRMADNHVPLRWGPGRHGPGHNLFFMIHDPDGNWVELSAELDVLPDDAPMGQWKHEERTLNSWGQAFLRS
jgi:catechol 2,3-dioxygenase-like lactoylglutathione lyase family enzyme